MLFSMLFHTLNKDHALYPKQGYINRKNLDTSEGTGFSKEKSFSFFFCVCLLGCLLVCLFVCLFFFLFRSLAHYSLFMYKHSRADFILYLSTDPYDVSNLSAYSAYQFCLFFFQNEKIFIIFDILNAKRGVKSTLL